MKDIPVREMPGSYVYAGIAPTDAGTLVKIGVSSALIARLQTLQNCTPLEFERVYAFAIGRPLERKTEDYWGRAANRRAITTECRQAEKAMHAKFEHLRVRGEWFKVWDNKPTEEEMRLFAARVNVDVRGFGFGYSAMYLLKLPPTQTSYRPFTPADAKLIIEQHPEPKAPYWGRNRKLPPVAVKPRKAVDKGHIPA